MSVFGNFNLSIGIRSLSSSFGNDRKDSVVAMTNGVDRKYQKMECEMINVMICFWNLQG